MPSAVKRILVSAACCVALATTACKKGESTPPIAPGGESGTQPGRSEALAFIQPRSVEVLPFTKPKSFDSDPIPDGVEVTLRVQDVMGDPVKAWGTFRFELFDRRPASADPRGDAVQNWTQSVGTTDEQRGFWDRVTQTYRFPLSWLGAPLTPNRKYVLDVTFQPPEGDRIFAEPYEFEFKLDLDEIKNAARQPASADPAAAERTGAEAPAADQTGGAVDHTAGNLEVGRPAGEPRAEPPVETPADAPPASDSGAMEAEPVGDAPDAARRNP